MNAKVSDTTQIGDTTVLPKKLEKEISIEDNLSDQEAR